MRARWAAAVLLLLVAPALTVAAGPREEFESACRSDRGLADRCRAARDPDDPETRAVRTCRILADAILSLAQRSDSLSRSVPEDGPERERVRQAHQRSMVFGMAMWGRLQSLADSSEAAAADPHCTDVPPPTPPQ